MYIDIDKTSKTPMTRQLYNSLRAMIISKQLESGYRLPSSRKLASELSVSRVVILDAYEQLIAEGFLETSVGSGTYVSKLNYLSKLQMDQYNQTDSSYMAEDQTGLIHEPEDNIVDFRTGLPDLALFPIDKWGQLYKRICQDISSYQLDYYQAMGSYKLRVELLRYLNRSRGIIAKPEQMLITTGAAQAFTLLSRLLLNKSETVLVEDPINKDIYSMLISTGANVISIPVDEHGIDTAQFPTQKIGKLVFTTPSHQFPMGGILSMQRRLELIQYVKDSGGYIIEDDYDSAFRFKGGPISALHSIAHEQVIYIGTFSKILFPALRIGYIILPNNLVEGFTRLKYLEDLHTPILEQLTLASFIRDGYLEKHIKLCKKVYQKKNQHLQDELIRLFGHSVQILGVAAGIHLVVVFKNTTITTAMYEAFSKQGVKITPIECHTKYPSQHTQQLMLGYGHLSLEDITKGVEIIKSVMTH